MKFYKIKKNQRETTLAEYENHKCKNRFLHQNVGVIICVNAALLRVVIQIMGENLGNAANHVR